MFFWKFPDLDVFDIFGFFLDVFRCPMFILTNAIVVIGSVSLVIWTIYGYFVLPKMHKNSWAYKIWSWCDSLRRSQFTVGCHFMRGPSVLLSA
jgi:hypothetical protein